MPRLTHGARRSGSIQDLAELLSLDDTPGKVLLVSDRTLYLLANLAMDEVRQYSAYAISYGDADLYYAVEYEDSEATDVDEIANNFGLEVIPVSDIRPIYSLTGALTTATSSIPNDTVTDLPITTLDAIPAELVSYSSGAFTINRSGRLSLSMRAYWAGNIAGYRQCRITLDGALIGLAMDVPQTAVAYAHGLVINPYVNAGQVVRFEVRHNAGAALNLNGGTAPSYLTSLSIIGY